MFCTSCGNLMPDDALFCTACGAKLSPLTAPAPDNVQAWQQTPSTQASTSRNLNTGQLAPTKKPLGRAIVIGLIAAIALVALVVVALVFGLRIFEQSDGQEQIEPASPVAASQTTSVPTLDLHISQVDNSAFPSVALYASIEGGDMQIDGTLFTLTEFSSNGASYLGTIDSIAPLALGDAMNINLVLDQSGSMDSMGKMSSAKAAANAFIDEITASEGNVAEITAFDDYVRNVQPFTHDATLLKSAVNSLSPDGDTALYDALFWSLQRTNLKSGSRVIIAFTDGEENASYYAESDVVELSRMTGIPVYIVGIGDSVDRSSLQALASRCNGAYFDASTTNLQTALSSIYDEIYTDQRSMYRIVYTSSYTGDESSYRTVRIECAEDSGYAGSTETAYMPVDNVSSFETSVNARDYVLPDSGSRYYSRTELERLSLWELYLARNEIFARYGRGFKNQDLVEYFATKRWYHEIYTPEEFDAMPTPLNDYEQKNTVAMLEIERERNSPYIS